jgi:hypothetical protein
MKRNTTIKNPPDLERIHVSDGCLYSEIEYRLHILQRNQEKIYSLLKQLLAKESK